MKSVVVIVFACIVSLVTNARTGYHYDDIFVECSVIDNGKLYVQPNEERRGFFDNKLKMSIPYKDPMVEAFANGSYIVNSSEIIDCAEDYVSPIYKLSTGYTAIVLPRILLTINNGQDIEEIIKLFNGKLIVEKAMGLEYSLRINTNHADEVLATIARIDSLKLCKWCEPDMFVNASFDNDNPLYNQQYYIRFGQPSEIVWTIGSNVENAWGLILGSNKVKVAIIDSGVQSNHEDLNSGVVMTGYTCGPINSYGTPVLFDSDLADQHCNNKFHGTSCAGIVAAKDNTVGICGVAAGVKILPVNIAPYQCNSLHTNGFASNSEISEAIKWAYKRSHIINCSWSTSYSSAIAQAIDSALVRGRGGKGCIVIAASGNDYPSSGVAFPACKSGVVSVGSTDRYGQISSFSQRGNDLKIVAPGEDIYTLDLMNGVGYSNYSNYLCLSGTSFSAPQVAGVAALMLSINPNLSAYEVRSILYSSAYDLGDTGYDTTYGHGLVDAYSAVYAAIPSFKIIGKTILCQGTSNDYYIENLSDDFSVVWHGSNNLVVEQDIPETNHCRVSVLGGATTNSLLTATIYNSNGIQLGVATLSVATQFTGTYSQDACAFYGVNHPAIPQSILTSTISYFVHQGCLVHVHSGLFKNQVITHSGITPDYWWQGQTDIEFSLPYLSGGTPFQVFCNLNGSDYDFVLTFFTVSNNGNLTQNSGLDVMATGSGYRISILSLDSGDGILQRCDASTNGEVQWGLEVIDVLTNRQMLATTVQGESYELDTVGWPHGTYAVRAYVGDEPFVTKILVK